MKEIKGQSGEGWSLVSTNRDFNKKGGLNYL